jgi:hypothetical protein
MVLWFIYLFIFFLEGGVEGDNFTQTIYKGAEDTFVCVYNWFNVNIVIFLVKF